MIRPILMASVIALAAPAVAQNSTVDDMTQAAPTQGMATPTAPDVATPTAAPGPMPPATPVDTMADPDADMDPNSSVATGTMTDTGTATTTPPATGTTTTTTSTTGYTGVGGPAEPARDYPRCSATVTDSCIQIGRRGQPL